MSHQSTKKKLLGNFSAYILPGRVTDPTLGLEQAKQAEQLGLVAVWISERYAVKEPAVLSGAVSQVTSRVLIAGTMSATLRNPVVTASVANVMQAISGNRFRLVLARGVPSHLAQLGSPPIDFHRLEDFVSIMRRLWAGEMFSYDGILGNYPELHLTDRYDGPTPPIIFTAIGPKSLAFTGRYCDGVLLHPFLTTQGVKRSVGIVRQAAQAAGRDPLSVKIYSIVLVAADLPKNEEEAIVGARGITYFQIPKLGEMVCEINGWDTEVLNRIRAHSRFTELGTKLADHSFTREQLIDVGRLLPEEWLQQGAVTGSAADCAKRLTEFRDAGADEIVLHGSVPSMMEALIEELKNI